MVFLPRPVLAQSSNAESLREAVWKAVAEKWAWFRDAFVGEDLAIQLAFICGALLLGWLLSLAFRPLMRRFAEVLRARRHWAAVFIDWLVANAVRLSLASLLWAVSLSLDAYHREQALAAPLGAAAVHQAGGQATLSQAGLAKIEPKNYLLVRAAASVATLLLVTSSLPRAIRKKAYFKTLFFVLALGLILNLLGVWNAIREGLNGLKILPISEGGTTQVTAFTILKGVLTVLVIFPVTGWLLRTMEGRVRSLDQVSPALQALILKVAKTLLVTVAILFAISSMGIDLSALAVLGGAVGLGLGFGFQKVVSNLISGVILLGDRSIKPGDVIQVDETYGWINTLGARYASVITRDGTEHLIPNETLITEKVVNWSFSDNNVRLRVPFGVSYSSDIHLAMKLAIEAANEHARVLKSPPAAVRLMGFGDNSVDFEMRIWICDPREGISNLRSDLYVRIWDLFKANGVEFPFPQRDLHLRDSVPLEVVLKRGGETGAGAAD